MPHLKFEHLPLCNTYFEVCLVCSLLRENDPVCLIVTLEDVLLTMTSAIV